MSKTKFSLTEDANGKSLALFYADGDTETIPETHVSFKRIVNLLINEEPTDDEIRELTNVFETVTRKMTALSERVSVDNKKVYFDGDELDGEVAAIIKDLFVEGRTLDFKPLVNFLEKCKMNPSMQSIDHLYRWIKNGDLVIDPDGDIIAYKGVQVNNKGISESISTGTAFVNGEEVKGHIPNVPGTVISMARSQVNPDSYVACSTGLHAGTYRYASGFAQGRLILVKINPRDVVSVPSDSANQKMRVSRYVVMSEIEHRLESRFYQPELDEGDEDDYDEDEYDYDYEYEGDFLEEDEDEEDYVEEREDDESEETTEPSDTVKYFTAVLNPAVIVKRNSQGRRTT